VLLLLLLLPWAAVCHAHPQLHALLLQGDFLQTQRQAAGMRRRKQSHCLQDTYSRNRQKRSVLLQ
jgi:hypothetical protein